VLKALEAVNGEILDAIGGMDAEEHGGAAEGTILQEDVDLHRGIAPAVEDLAGGDVGDKGVLKALEAVNGEILDAIGGMDAEEQAAIDEAMIELDDVHHRHRQDPGLGAADVAVERQAGGLGGGLGDGKGVLKALEAVNGEILDAIGGMDAEEQAAIDEAVDDVHHRHRQDPGLGAADVAVERQAGGLGGGLGTTRSTSRNS
jgi:hypothetical protein